MGWIQFMTSPVPIGFIMFVIFEWFYALLYIYGVVTSLDRIVHISMYFFILLSGGKKKILIVN